jgi:hypothetical protein
MTTEEQANHIVIKLKEQANSIREKRMVRTNQNQGDNTNL